MHKQIASSALSLAVTLATSILPSYEIEFASDAAPPPQPAAVAPPMDAAPETGHVRFSTVDMEHELEIQVDEAALSAPHDWR